MKRRKTKRKKRLANFNGRVSTMVCTGTPSGNHPIELTFSSSRRIRNTAIGT